MVLQKDSFNELTSAKYGYMLYNKNDRYIGRSIEVYGEFSELEVEFFKKVCRVGSTVIEVGANIGAHTIALSKLVGSGGRVYAFEPQRVVFQTLCANLALNSIVNVEAFHMALSYEDGSILIPDLDYSKKGNFGGVEIEKFQDGYRVKKMKLDNILELKSLKRLDLLKIDVEGMERDVLLGAKSLIKKFQPIMYIENDRVLKSKELLSLIDELDYDIYYHNPPLFNDKNFRGCSENIFGNIVSKNLICISRYGKKNILDKN